MSRARAGEKLLDLGQDLLGAGWVHPGQVIVTGQFAIGGTLDLLGQEPAVADVTYAGPPPMEDERRYVDGATDGPDVDAERHPLERDRLPRPGRLTHQPL